MSFVITTPDLVSTAAQDVATLHSTLTQATASAAAPTTGVIAAAEDEISAGVASAFSSFGQDFQAVSAQAHAFHEMFFNLLNTSAGSYLSAEAANVQQTLANSVETPAQALLGQPLIGTGGLSGLERTIAAPYQNLIANTTANLQTIGTAWSNSTAPALLQALATQTGYPQQILTALETGNLSSIVGIAGRIGQGVTNVIQELTVPVSVSLTDVTPLSATLTIGAGLPELLAFDALGGPVNAATAFTASSSAFFGALAAGNPLAAATALIDAPANIANAFLNGQETLSLSVPFAGQSLTAPVPFSGLLVPLEPLSVTTTTITGSPVLQTITLTAPPVGGLIPALVDYAPELIAAALDS